MIKPSPIVKNVVLHDKQFEAFNFTTQYAAAVAGVQSGKTFVGTYWAANQIAIMPKDGEGLIVAPTVKILQQGTLAKFFKEFPSYQRYYKEQKGVIEFPDGRKVWIRSADNPYGIESMTLDWIWGDEAGNFKLIVWAILRSRTAIKRGKIFFTTTPYNMGWLYQDFYLPWQRKEDKDLSVFTWASIDNPYFPKEFYNKEKIRLRAEEFKRRYEGAFSRMEGLVYRLSNWHIVPPTKLRAEITLGGVDWGFTNPAALVIIKIVDGQYFIIDEWYETGKTTPEIIEQMIKMQNAYGVNRWYADSANPEKIAEAGTNTGLYVVGYEKQKDSISAGISQIQSYLNENRLFVFNTCKNALAEFESYHYPEREDTRNNKEDPEPFDNHLMDAMRYAIHGYQPAKRVRVPIVNNTSDRIRTLITVRENDTNQSTCFR